MKEIAAKLIEFGMDFQYENRCSQGEEIMCFPLDLNVTISQGTIYYTLAGEKLEFKEKDNVIKHIVSLIDTACVEHTT